MTSAVYVWNHSDDKKKSVSTITVRNATFSNPGRLLNIAASSTPQAGEQAGHQ